MKRFDSKWVPDPETGCHVWTAGTQAKGYGKFWLNGRTVMAHRFAYECAHGPIAPGLEVHHRCENKLCVNPDHLEVETPRNHKRLHPQHLAAINVAKTHCPRGHPYDDENTYHNPGGWRECRRCSRAATNAWRRKKKAAVA